MIRRICCGSGLNSTRFGSSHQRWLLATSSSSSSSSSTIQFRRRVSDSSSSSSSGKPPRNTTIPKKGKATVNINDVISANNSFEENTARADTAAEEQFDMAALRNRRAAMDSDIALDGATVVKFLQERRLEDVLLVDVSRKCSWTNAMVFATGKSERQMVAAANALVKEYREIIPTCAEDRRIMEVDEHWVALDCGLVVVHLFSAHGRALYKLDQTWINRPNLNESGLLVEGDEANMSAEDDYVDDPETEAAIAAAADEARLDPATFGLTGSATVDTRARVVPRERSKAKDNTDAIEGEIVTDSTDGDVAPRRRKLIRGVLASRMAANGVWPPTRSVTVSSDDD
jgi:ribosome-associated protein